jgi:hypothetical protein
MAPVPGSASWFALLYFPPERRRGFALLLALEAEIGAGLVRGLDHALAHARLDFWREEAARHAQGAARHPWLRSSAPAAAPVPGELERLVHAALVDLADARHTAPVARALRGAIFCAAARLLDAQPLGASDLASLNTLGALSAELERAPPDTARQAHAAARERLQQTLTQLGPTQQRRWVPLLVWCAIDARQAARAETSSRLAVFADNVAAWKAARAAAAGILRVA